MRQAWCQRRNQERRSHFRSHGFLSFRRRVDKKKMNKKVKKEGLIAHGPSLCIWCFRVALWRRKFLWATTTPHSHTTLCINRSFVRSLVLLVVGLSTFFVALVLKLSLCVILIVLTLILQLLCSILNISLLCWPYWKRTVESSAEGFDLYTQQLNLLSFSFVQTVLCWFLRFLKLVVEPTYSSLTSGFLQQSL